MSQVPTRQIRRLSRAQMIYWPEHFLPHISGSPVSYESLTLDLFMLGYFQLLEMNMSRSERKFRHLLCYEMFDRLGSHKWEVIRQFHKAVMESIEKGNRDWADGFEEIKVRYFGDSNEGGGVLTASLQSMSPDTSFMLIPESLPPPPSHPPPPPPPTNPAPPPPNLQSSSAPASQFTSSSCAASKNDVSDNGHCVQQTPWKESIEDNGQRGINTNDQIYFNEPVVSNGNRSGHDHIQSLTSKTMQPTNTMVTVETQQDTTKSSSSLEDVPPATVRFTEEPHVDNLLSGCEHDENSIKVIYDLKEFSNEEIIKYIDRSFAFWKQKEAELFDI